jgi:hypothetical protein
MWSEAAGRFAHIVKCARILAPGELGAAAPAGHVLVEVPSYALPEPKQLFWPESAKFRLWGRAPKSTKLLF